MGFGPGPGCGQTTVRVGPSWPAGARGLHVAAAALPPAHPGQARPRRRPKANAGSPSMISTRRPRRTGPDNASQDPAGLPAGVRKPFDLGQAGHGQPRAAVASANRRPSSVKPTSRSGPAGGSINKDPAVTETGTIHGWLRRGARQPEPKAAGSSTTPGRGSAPAYQHLRKGRAGGRFKSWLRDGLSAWCSGFPGVAQKPTFIRCHQGSAAVEVGRARSGVDCGREGMVGGSGSAAPSYGRAARGPWGTSTTGPRQFDDIRGGRSGGTPAGTARHVGLGPDLYQRQGPGFTGRADPTEGTGGPATSAGRRVCRGRRGPAPPGHRNPAADSAWRRSPYAHRAAPRPAAVATKRGSGLDRAQQPTANVRRDARGVSVCTIS